MTEQVDPTFPEPGSQVELEAPWRSLLRFDELDSTQLLASRWVAQGRDMRGIVLRAERQSAGQGRLDHRWVSAPGGLYVTAGLPYDLPLRGFETGWVCLLAALACIEALHEQLGLEARIKWPNDVFIEGRKLAGLLGELRQPEASGGQSTARLFLIGMGLNWLNPVRPAAEAQSFLAATVGELRPDVTLDGREDFLRAWLGCMNAWHERLKADYNRALRSLSEDVERLLWRKGECVCLRNTEKGSVTGNLLGLGRGGAARVRLAQGEETLVHCGWQSESGLESLMDFSESFMSET
jgi:biotin-[acetyl-CoA-carboxylase] ligase BirA-like protein